MQPSAGRGRVRAVGDLTGDLADLYSAAQRRLVLAVFAVTGDVAEAEDCVQEAFARAVPRWPRLAAYDDPEAWLYRVAVNLARSRWRQLRRAAALRTRSVPDPPAPGLTEDHVALTAALRLLPDEQREAVVLHHIGDLPVTEIAARQGVPVGTVKARLSRARAALARQLGVAEEEVSIGE